MTEEIKPSVESTVREIRWNSRKKSSPEEKVRICMSSEHLGHIRQFAKVWMPGW